MSASVWQAEAAISANNSVRFQPFVATANQTLFEIPPEAFSYVPGTSSLLVFQSSGAQRPGIDFVETSSSSFTLTTPVAEGTVVLAMAFVQVSATLDALQLRNDLANAGDPSKGAALVGFLPTGTGAVTTDVQTKLREIISVKDFGADPGASASANTVAIQNAINAAVGKTLLFPSDGIYYTNALTIPANSNTKILGQNTILYLGSSGNLFTIDGTGSDPNITITIRGLILNGNSKASSKLLYIKNTHGVKVEDCQFYDVSGAGSYHVHLDEAWVFQMDNCFLQAAAVDCDALLYVQGSMQQANFTNCRFLSNATGDGVLIDSAINNNFYGCDFEGCFNGVRLIAGAGVRCDNNQFNGCDWEDNETGIRIGSTGTTDAVLGTVIQSSNITNVTPGKDGVCLDKATRTSLLNVSLGNIDITTTANTVQTFYKRAYGGTAVEGCNLYINNTGEWIDLNVITGTWTPNILSTTGNSPSGYNPSPARYVRNGRLCTIEGHVYWTGILLTGEIQITNLPYKFKNTANMQQIIPVIGGDGGGFVSPAGTQLIGMGQPNTSIIKIKAYNPAAGTWTPVPPTASGILYFTGTYEIEDN